ncbi:MAG: type II toxin-antitoxin system PemK/MazF family toxin [bacterium]
MKRGDIYWANLDPVIGSEISKTRPVLIISNDINNTFSNTITILPITTSTRKIYPFEVLIKKNDSGLSSDSKIKANQIRTIDKQRLYKKISKLTSKKIIEVEEAIIIHLGINL